MNKHNRRRKYKLKSNTLYTLLAILFFGMAGLTIISFGQQGELLTRLYEYLYELVGAGIYLIPINCIAIGFLIVRSKTFLSKPNLSIGMALSSVSLVTISRSGTVGQRFWLQLSELLSSPGAALVLIGGLVIGIVIFFNTSLDQLINGLGAFLTVLANAIKSPSSPLEKKKELTKKQDFEEKKKGLFGLDKFSLKVRGGNEETRPTAPQSFIKQPPKPQGTLSSEMVMNQPRSPGVANIWEYPPVSLLQAAPSGKADRGNLKENAGIIERTLESFGIAARVVEVNLGPAVTQYALKIALGTKLSKITSLANDLALALAAPTGQIRIEAPIPGRSLVGIEIPNRSLEFVTLKQMLQSDTMRENKTKLTVALGLDVSGSPLVVNIARMPHVLIAGTTGSGKSVLINAWICSLLYRATPDEVKLIMVDPKRVELVGYNGIPHLLTPVIVETDKILSALKWAMQEMDRRYKQFAEVGVRNIDSFNEVSGFQALPYIVIFVDELADLMAYAPVEVEDAICRLAQMARATGIHLVIATQRPSVDVITGLIKANVPSRIAFNVSSMIDSRVIIDTPGAEKLLGRGDMLYIPPDQAKPSRVQGTFVSELEVQKLVGFLKSKNAPVEYTEEVTSMPVSAWKKGAGGTAGADGTDELFQDAVRTVCQHDRASASLLQRRLSIGYARAARILDQLEAAGIVGPGEGSKPRDVLIKNADEYFQQTQGSASTTPTATE
ncbi:MAG: cell division FtsK/SpoIIIE [Candidatus Gottesmanbacteria bacterium GW2011_GWA1_43_11]|uniref:Cell division FtsK/SpoIIIE n=1 Tax=Candidatus Gottesmanbacteria bacterium GW2011_GWA1_43_11 TaxID=1618436 RepID=A0A0G1FC65_9BACT|nr:MAG: cell division FtsK/SpoIIIE [Candidatus Gottesmanbacteria bacterium GW2011_GWA1_43_11]